MSVRPGGWSRTPVNSSGTRLTLTLSRRRPNGSLRDHAVRISQEGVSTLASRFELESFSFKRLLSLTFCIYAIRRSKVIRKDPTIFKVAWQCSLPRTYLLHPTILRGSKVLTVYICTHINDLTATKANSNTHTGVVFHAGPLAIVHFGSVRRLWGFLRAI